jgi:hypothetical protein
MTTTTIVIICVLAYLLNGFGLACVAAHDAHENGIVPLKVGDFIGSMLLWPLIMVVSFIRLIHRNW